MSEQRHTGDDVNLLREGDRWLRRVAFYGPAIGVIIGWQLGFISAVWMFRDHEKRITSLEAWHYQHDANDRIEFANQKAFEDVVREKLNLR